MEMKTPTEARWRRSQIAETFASVRVSAPCYRVAKYIVVLSIVEAERKLVQVQRQVLLADVMVRSHHATLQERPEVFEVLSMNLAAHVLALHMVHSFMAETAMQMFVANILIGRDQADSVADSLTYETFQRRSRGVFDHLADHVALARDRTDDTNLARTKAASPKMLALASVLVLFLSTNESLVYFDDTHKLAEIGIGHSSAQAMAHIPSCPCRRLLAKKHSPNLPRRNALFALQDRVENLEPSFDRMLGVREDRSGCDRETEGVTLPTFFVGAFPFPRLSDLVDGFGLAAAWAGYAIRPTTIGKVLTASRFVGESRHKCLEGQHEGNIAQAMLSVKCGNIALFSMPEGLKGTLFFPSVANLKSARTLALDDDFAVLRAQFDLANVTDRRRVSTL